MLTKLIYESIKLTICTLVIGSNSLFVFICLYCSNSYGQNNGLPLIRNYTPKEYNGGSVVFASIQDRNTGIIYFGADGLGICSYDGVNWNAVPAQNLFNIYSFAQSKDGIIYATYIGNFGYLDVNTQGQIEFKSLKSLLPDTTVDLSTLTSLKVTDNSVYFQSFNNIFQYLPTEKKIVVFPIDSGGYFISDFAYNNIYYTSTETHGLYKIDKNILSQAPYFEYFKRKNGFGEAIHFGKDTILIPSRYHGLSLYFINGKNAPEKFEIENSDFLIENDIYSSSKSFNGFILGSLRKGALLIDRNGKTIQHYNESSLLLSNIVYATLSDAGNNIWLSLENGISKIESTNDFTYWNKHNGLKGNVQSVIEYNKKIYVSTFQNVYCIENGIPKEITGIPTGQCWDLAEFKVSDSQSFLLVGTSNGIYQIVDNKASCISRGKIAFCLFQSKLNPHRLYSTDYQELISLVYKNGKWIKEKPWTGITDVIYSIVEDKEGTLWLESYNKGVFKIKPYFDVSGRFEKVDEIKYYSESTGAGCKPFIYNDKILSGSTTGLLVYNKTSEKFEPFEGFEKMFYNTNNQIYSIIESKNGRIYLSPFDSKASDIGYINPNNKGGYDWIFEPFKRLPEIHAIKKIYLDSENNLWICSSEGLYKYNEKNDVKNYKAPFHCWIREVKLGHDSVIYFGYKNLNPSHSFNYPDKIDYINNSITFKFASPFFDCEERTLYSFQLENFDKEWSHWGRKTEKEYTNLREGTYTFKVKAYNIYRQESKIDTFKFTIKPPVYRTLLAYLLYFIVGLCVLYLVYRWRVSKLQKEKLILEEKVKTRTAELQQANEEITTQRDEIEAQRDLVTKQKQHIENIHEELTDSINYARRIQQAVLPVSEKARSILGEYFILYKPKDIVSGDFYFAEKRNNWLFCAVADCTGHGVPGAFMSMLGISFLNEIIAKDYIWSAGKVLDELRQYVINSLQQKGISGEQKDGMDICLVALNLETRSLQFAGANNPLWIVRSINGSFVLEEVKPDKQPVAIFPNMQPFTNNEIQLNSGDILYLASDGYEDQFGGPKFKKFYAKQMKELLLDICNKPMSEQKDILESTIENWMNGFNDKYEQTDDITIMGVKIK